MQTRKLVIALALLLAVPTLAAAQAGPFRGPPFLDLPRVVWQVSPVFGGTGVEITASTPVYAPNPPHEITIATLTLPAGNWMLSAKLSEWNFGDNMFGDLECALGDPRDPTGNDYASVGLGGTEKTLSLQVPVSTTGRSTTVTFACHLYGVKFDGVSLATATVWGAKIYAQQIGPIVEQ